MIARPASVTRAVIVVAAMVVIGAVIVLLTWLLRDDLLTAWAEGNSGAREILREGGLEAVEETLTVPAFVPVAVTAWVVFAMLAGVLVVFFIEGFAWARYSLAAIAVFGVFLAGVGVSSGIPPLFVAGSAVMVGLCLLLLYLLFHKDTSRYFREL